MDIEKCYNLLHLNSTFLGGLYTSNELSFKKLLAAANDSQIKTLLMVKKMSLNKNKIILK